MVSWMRRYNFGNWKISVSKELIFQLSISNPVFMPRFVYEFLEVIIINGKKSYYSLYLADMEKRTTISILDFYKWIELTDSTFISNFNLETNQIVDSIEVFNLRIDILYKDEENTYGLLIRDISSNIGLLFWPDWIVPLIIYNSNLFCASPSIFPFLVDSYISQAREFDINSEQYASGLEYYVYSSNQYSTGTYIDGS